MITGERRSQTDRIWDSFWAGGIANPLEVIEQITDLLFMRRLDELHTLIETRDEEAVGRQPSQLQRRDPLDPDGDGPGPGALYRALGQPGPRGRAVRGFASLVSTWPPDVTGNPVAPAFQVMTGGALNAVALRSMRAYRNGPLA